MCRSGWRKLADSVLRTYRQYIHLLVNTFYWVSDSHCEAGKIKLIEKRQIMADKRQGLSICQFARQFSPHRRYMVIRAVWNTLQGNGYIDYPLPLKASDKLDDDLDLVNDADELEELVEDIAARCGRDLRGIEDNPFLPITTVGSLVSVLNAQPMTQERRSLLFTRS